MKCLIRMVVVVVVRVTLGLESVRTEETRAARAVYEVNGEYELRAEFQDS